MLSAACTTLPVLLVRCRGRRNGEPRLIEEEKLARNAEISIEPWMKFSGLPGFQLK